MQRMLSAIALCPRYLLLAAAVMEAERKISQKLRSKPRAFVFNSGF